jgi:hypothetical protein
MSFLFSLLLFSLPGERGGGGGGRRKRVFAKQKAMKRRTKDFIQSRPLKRGGCETRRFKGLMSNADHINVEHSAVRVLCCQYLNRESIGF